VTHLMKDARFRRLVGIVERVVLGSAMALALLAAEWQLGRMQRRKVS
jgi:hypothetical protein